MSLSPDRDVLLFFQDYDQDTFVSGDRRLRRVLRRVYQTFRQGRPKTTGFEVWFRLLSTALERAGKRVHVNAYRLARRNPSYPIGLCGYPHILDDLQLPNPCVLGPGLLDHPSVRPDLMQDPRFRLYVTTCDWNYEMFAPVYGKERCVHWHAGIDTDEWSDKSGSPKDVDVVIYDKIRWNRDRLVPAILDSLVALIGKQGLKHEIIRYGRYDHAQYREMLARSKSMVFLCEHETQGMAYQEAMASNLPILAWDPGIWLDPSSARYSPDPIPACSVPFFDARCGERFKDETELEQAFTRFWQKRTEYQPRAFVKDQLSFAGSAKAYLSHLAAAAR
jgi:hypothetical protein